MKKELMFVLSLIFGILLLAYIIALVGLDKIIGIFEIFPFYRYLIIFAIYFLIYTFVLNRWSMIIKAFNYKVSFSKLFSIKNAEYAFSYITPFSRLGGEPVMAYLFKKECGMKYRKGIAIIVLNKVMDFSSGFILAFIGIMLFLFSHSQKLPQKTSIILIIALVFFSILFYLFYIKLAKRQGFFSLIMRPFKGIFHKNIHNNILIVEKELHDFFDNRKKLVGALCISFMANIMLLTNYYLLALAFGVHLSIAQLLIIFSFTVLSYIFPIPGSLGSFEGSMAFAFSAIGLGANLGVAFALILRTFELIIIGIGLMFLSYYGIFKEGIRIQKV